MIERPLGLRCEQREYARIVAEYDKNIGNLTKDVQKQLDVPKLRFLILKKDSLDTINGGAMLKVLKQAINRRRNEAPSKR